MKNEILKNRTKKLGLEIIKLVDTLPKNTISYIIGKQILRSGTSIGANYRSVCRARSKADFIAKLGIVEEEADETLYWFELLIESGLVNKNKIQYLIDETNEIISIVVASIKTARGKIND